MLPANSECRDSMCIDPRWEGWLAENLLRGVDPRKVAAAMIEKGFDRVTAEKHIRSTFANPMFAAALEANQRLHKLQTLLGALSAQRRQSPNSQEIEVRNDISADEFYQDYYFANRPVVIRGLMDGWRALKLWTVDYFAVEFGDCEIEITSGRTSDELYEENFARHRSTVRMRDYVQMILGADTNDFYLVAKNNLLERMEFQQLFEHFRCPLGFLDPARVKRRVKIWFGPKGTITPLHHDGQNVFFGQIRGRKQIKLISPYDLENIYNDRECFSSVDLDRIDYTRFPRMLEVPIIDVVIEPGDFILLPLGWWHWVKSLDPSISLSFWNFCIDGEPIVWSYR